MELASTLANGLVVDFTSFLALHPRNLFFACESRDFLFEIYSSFSFELLLSTYSLQNILNNIYIYSKKDCTFYSH